MSKDRYCKWSTQTVEKVESCPVSISEWEKRKEIKKCSLLAHKQNCTDASNFEYHCVINEYENALTEVCAPAYMINGKFLRTKKKTTLQLTLFTLIITFFSKISNVYMYMHIY